MPCRAPGAAEGVLGRAAATGLGMVPAGAPDADETPVPRPTTGRHRLKLRPRRKRAPARPYDVVRRRRGQSGHSRHSVIPVTILRIILGVRHTFDLND